MKISAVVLNKNEEAFVHDCLESLAWVDEIVFLDGGSTDDSVKIAGEFRARVIKQEGKGFAQWRNQGLKEAKNEWVLFLDIDERITPLLRKEIEDLLVKEVQFSAYAIPRRNLLLGKELRHGGWYPDYVKRLFIKKDLHQWVGDLHEEPVFDKELGKLINPMVHLQPEKIEPALKKSIKWSEMEERLLHQANHPVVVWWRGLRGGG